MKKWANELNRAFSKEVHMAKKHIRFTIPSLKGNVNQNHVVSTSLLSE
jgi:hypothetical protein